ncbi:hypothetical protein M758_UG341400 [Ceratodon purpureus]|nr:hypothetical protein M758_UG341400 [Ceratodon purpureus]
MEVLRAWYFTATLSTTAHCAQLEIPPAFTKRTGWLDGADCSLVTSINFKNEWPVRFEQSASSGGVVAWSSVGSGYRKILEDNKVHLPVLLVFEMVDDNTLVVTIHHDDTPPL